MFLEVATLLVLVLVLLVKFVTSRHTASLNQEKLELENSCRAQAALYKKLSKDRQSSETSEKNLQKARGPIETKLEEARQAVAEQIERNQDLGDQTD